MRNTARQTRDNRTITVDFHDEETYFQLLDDGKAFVELVSAFILALGFQLRHQATYRGGGCLTRHSHYVRVRLGDLTIWRLQCTTCKAVFTVLPHIVLRYRQMRPEMARDALLATHGGLRLDNRVLWPCSPGVGCLCPSISWLMRSIATVCETKCICQRSSMAVCSGIWATRRTPVRRP